MTPRKRLKNIPSSMRKVYRRAMKGKSRTAGVKAFCQECVGYVTKCVRNCTDTGCPLWPYRPYQTKEEDDE